MRFEKNDFFLRAFKPAENLTLVQRTERILSQQRFISDELKTWTWFLTDKTEIDIRDDACKALIYKQVKKDLNTKRVKIIHYQPEDIPDSQSSCIFIISKKFYPEPFIVSHRLGYYGEYSQTESINIDQFIREEHLNNEPTITALAELILKKYKPRELYLSTKEYFHNYSNPPENAPWTGWITYLDNSIYIPQPKPTFCNVDQRSWGTMFQTTNRIFNDDDPDHIKSALRLEKWFADNKVEIQTISNQSTLKRILSKYLPRI